MGLPAPVAEVMFAPGRKFRFDYAWPEYRVALEVEGGVWTGGRHTRGAGYAKDCEKYSIAASLGWLIVRVQPKDLLKTQTAQWVNGAINNRC